MKKFNIKNKLINLLNKGVLDNAQANKYIQEIVLEFKKIENENNITGKLYDGIAKVSDDFCNEILLLREENKKLRLQILNKQKTISPGKINCIKCDKKLNPLSMGISEEEEFYNIEETMWGDGVVDTFSAGYGSEHDGDVFYFGICDECITKLKKNNKIIFKTKFL